MISIAHGERGDSGRGGEGERKVKVLEKGHYGGLLTAGPEEGTYCWYCGEHLEGNAYSEAPIDSGGRLVWVPVCEDCCPTPPPTRPLAARLACPVCNETLAPPRRHSCGGAA